MKTQISVSLKFPVTINGETTATLTMRRPQTVDVVASLATSDYDLTQDANLFANLCMVTPALVDELDATDFAKLTEAFNEFSEFEPLENYAPGDSIALVAPIKVDGKECVSVKMRRPKTKDLREAQSASVTAAGQDVVLYAALTGLTSEQINQLDWSDMRKIKRVYAGFLE